MKNQVKSFVFFLPIFFGCIQPYQSTAQSDHFVITGEIEGLQDSTYLYLYYLEAGEIVDSVLVLDEKFQFKGSVDEPSRYIIQNKDYKNFMYKYLWVENTDIRITGDTEHFREAHVTGSKTEEEDQQFTSMLKPYEQKRDSLRQGVREKIKNEDTTGIKSMKKEIATLEQQIKAKKIAFFKDHLSSYVTASRVSFACLTHELEKEEIAMLYALFPDHFKKATYGQNIESYLTLYNPVTVGDTANDFTQLAVDGQNVSLSDYKGKYVLLEFWGSGCGPCRKENPNLVKLYEKYKALGFEILGVSLDGSREQWEKAIEKDKLLWTNVSDLKGSYNEAALMYGVSYIPKNYLIDPQGVIIDEDLRGEDLKVKLEELFNI